MEEKPVPVKPLKVFSPPPPPPSMTHPMTCGTCGDALNMTACAGCARRDLEGMRSFQVKFMKADHEKRALELQVSAMDALNLEWANKFLAQSAKLDDANRLVDGLQKVFRAAVGLRDHGSDLQRGTHAQILWHAIAEFEMRVPEKRNPEPQKEMPRQELNDYGDDVYGV